MKRRARIHRTNGQALVLLTLAFVALLLMLGLVVDLGQIFIAKGYLRKATDAASLAAAAQFREGRTPAEMAAAAREAIRLNGLDPTEVLVETCKDVPGDLELCPSATGIVPKKLVRVRVRLDYPLTFMTLANIYHIELSDYSISEAASMDVILIIDVSESMAWDKRYRNPDSVVQDQPFGADPSVCNLDNSCEPFAHVKSAAMDFAQQILDKGPTEEEDRLSIVTFATGWQAGYQGTQMTLQWTNDFDIARATIESLTVYDPGVRCQWDDTPPILDPSPKWTSVAQYPLEPCRYYSSKDENSPPTPADKMDDTVYYAGLDCPLMWDYPAAISACNTTNTGGGMAYAASYLAQPALTRKEALWVAILLTDGMANATEPSGDNTANLRTDVTSGIPVGHCPSDTWLSAIAFPNCIDHRALTIHWSGNALYDADDYARTQSLFLGCAAVNPAPECHTVTGQGAVIFTIGLGNMILRRDDDNIPYGAKLLRDVAAVGDDGDPDTDPCQGVTDWSDNCGNYYFAQGGSDLSQVFEAIASRIFTRLTQ